MTLSDFKHKAPLMNSNLHGDYSFTPENIYQEGSAENRQIIGGLIDQLMLPGSRIENIDALVEFYRRSIKGESCLILAEHYSNFDYPVLYRLMEKVSDLGTKASESLLPIRGMKLSELIPVVATFTRSFDSIVIYPSRTLDSIKDPLEMEKTRKISVPINHAAMREMIKRKHNGRIIVVFPSGTRYRPWNPDSQRGVREIHSYVKTFDNVIFLAINGNMLPPSKVKKMDKEESKEDLMILTCSDIINGRSFRKKIEKSAPEGKDPKQHVVDRVMEELLTIHNRVEPGRLIEKKNLCNQRSRHPDTNQP